MLLFCVNFIVPSPKTIFNDGMLIILISSSFFFVIVCVAVCFKVLGAGGNTFNEIRRKRQKDPMKTVRMRHFLSPVDIMPLAIRILKSGNISVAITGQPPFIMTHDSNVLDIKYLSFSYVFLEKKILQLDNIYNTNLILR